MSLVLGAAAVLLALPALSDLISLTRLRRSAAAASPMREARARLLFLVPAHDEELLLPGCLESLDRRHHAAAAYDVVVVADNCSDGTVAVAERAGVRCLERRDPAHPGKPAALAWAFDQVDLRACDAVVIVDADSVVEPGFAGHVAAVPGLRTRAAQAYNAVRNPGDSALTRLARVLSCVYYEFAHPLKQRAGLNVPLTGPGMCLGAEVIADSGWDAFSKSEDVEAYVRMTLRGIRTVGVPGARIRVQEAGSLGQSYAQRRRWRGGRLEILRDVGPDILRSRRTSLHQKLDLLAELVAPGPVVQVAVATGLAGVALWLRPAALVAIVLVLALPIVRLAAYTVLALTRDPHPWRALAAFACMPVYCGWRLGVEAAGWLGGVPDQWVRTPRTQGRP